MMSLMEIITILYFENEYKSMAECNDMYEAWESSLKYSSNVQEKGIR